MPLLHRSAAGPSDICACGHVRAKHEHLSDDYPAICGYSEPVMVDAGGKWMNDHAPSFAAVPSVVLAAVFKREDEWPASSLGDD